MKLYRCNCGSHAIHIERLEWLEGRDEVYFSIWYLGADNKWSVWDRLRYCWHVIKKSRPHADQICLYPADAMELGIDLTDMARAADIKNFRGERQS
jgi:hypothetical protein